MACHLIMQRMLVPLGCCKFGNTEEHWLTCVLQVCTRLWIMARTRGLSTSWKFPRSQAMCRQTSASTRPAASSSASRSEHNCQALSLNMLTIYRNNKVRGRWILIPWSSFEAPCLTVGTFCDACRTPRRPIRQMRAWARTRRQTIQRTRRRSLRARQAATPGSLPRTPPCWTSKAASWSSSPPRLTSAVRHQISTALSACKRTWTCTFRRVSQSIRDKSLSCGETSLDRSITSSG